MVSLGVSNCSCRLATFADIPIIGVLPGGKHEVGKIDERAKHNQESSMKLNEKTEANLLEAQEKVEALQGQGLSADAELPRKSSVGDAREQ